MKNVRNFQLHNRQIERGYVVTTVAFSPGALEQTYGGTSRYLFELISHLREQGTGAFVSSPALWNEYFLKSPVPLHRGLVASQLSRSRLSRKALNSYNRVVWQAPWVIRPAALLHQTYYFDHFNVTPNTPKILTVYDMIHELFPGQFKNAERTSRAKYQACQDASHIVTISDNTKSDLVEIFGIEPSRITTTHLASSITPSGNRDEEQRHPFLLHVGPRAGYKNFPKLLQALASLPAFMRGEVTLVAFGGGPASKNEHSLLEELRIRPGSVRFVEGDDRVLSFYYQKAQALVYLSLYEGFGIPPLEALTTSCPVIVSNRSSLPEVVGEAGILVDPEDEDKIAESISNLLDNPSLRGCLASKGRIQAQAFSWNKTTSETRAVYKYVLSKT